MKVDAHTLTMPPALLAQVEAAAHEEQRTTTALVQEAIERYLEDRQWQSLIAFGQAQARAAGLTEADVPRLIAESREEARRGH